MHARRLALLVCLPLIAASTQVAHAVAYWLVAPATGDRATLLGETGHGYQATLPPGGVLLAALGLVAILGAVIDGHRQRRGVAVGAAIFALAPFAAFALQEHLERLLAGDAAHLTATEPAFLLGFALQAPFALVAYLVARLLLVAVRSVRDRRGPAVRPGRSPALPPGRTGCPPPVLRRPVPLAAVGAGRAPPLLLAR